MEEAVIVAFGIIYIVIAVITYRIVHTMLMNDLDYNDPKDRELLEDKKAIWLVVGAASLLWIFYIPYLYVMSVIEANKKVNKF